MNSYDFEKVVSDCIANIQKTLNSKAKEYAHGSRLYNFERAAKIIDSTPEKAALGMMLKHLVSVLDLIDGKLENTKYMRDEKIGDMINYLVLIKAILISKSGGK